MKECIRLIQKVIDWLSFSEDKNDIGKLVVFSMFGICVLGSYGIEITGLIIHNLAVYEIAINKGIFKEAFSMYYDSALIALFTKHLSTLLVVPVPMLLASLAGKVVIFFLIYKIANNFITRKEYAYFLAVYFVLGGLATYGGVQNQISGAPLFNRAMVSTILILAGMYFWLKNKDVRASILLGASVYFHPLYSVSAITFLGFGITGQVFYKILEPKKLILPSIIIGSNIFYAAMISIDPTVTTVEMRTTFPEWYAFLNASNPDDAFMWWSLREYGYMMVPLLLLSWWMIRENRNREYVDAIFIGCLVGLTFILAVETMHSFGIFLGKISELFIVTEFRRGAWIFMFFGLVIVFRFFEKKGDFILNNKGVLISIIMLLAAYLSPSLPVVLFFTSISAIVMRNVSMGLVAISVNIYFFISLFYFPGIADNAKNNFMHFSTLNFIVMVSYFSFIFFSKDFKLKRITHVFSIVVILFLGVLLTRGLIEKRFYTSWEMISKNGVFSKIDYALLLSDFFKNTLPEDAIQNDHEFIKKMIKINKKHDFILLPPDSLSNRDRTVFKASIFLDMMDYKIGMFSKAKYEQFKNKLELIFGKKENEKIIKAISNMPREEWFIYVGELYRNIPFENFFRLNVKHGVRYIVTDKRYEGVEPVISGKRFMAYDMNLY